MTSIKNKAKSAKQRLSSGYWQEMRDKKKDELNAQGQEFERVKVEERYKRLAQNTDKIFVEDEEFLQKVREILSSDVEILNPLGILITEKDLADLDITARQRLIFKTSQRFLRAKEMILNEIDKE